MKSFIKVAVCAMSFGFFVPVGTSAHASTSPRHYDCSKAGNANKVACRAPAAPAPARPRSAAQAAGARGVAARHYNCALAGNANKAACRNTVAASPAMVPMTRVAPTPHATSRGIFGGARTTRSVGSGPQGATAICRDNSYSHSANHTGACSHHGGVKQFY